MKLSLSFFLGSILITPLITYSATSSVAKEKSTVSVQKIDLEKDLKSSGFVNLYETETNKKNAKLSNLAQLKSYEIQLKWNECAQLAPKVFTSQKEVRGWVVVTWLHCLDQSKDNNAAAEEKARTTLSSHPELFREGPWVGALSQAWISAQLDYFSQQVKLNNKKVSVGLDQLLDGTVELNKEQKSLAYQLLGDLALARSDYKEAQFLYSEAQAQKDSKYISDKLDFLAKTQGRASDTKSTTSVREMTGDEGAIEERFRQALRQNDLIPALKDAIALLNQFPGSRSARRLKDKPLEIYSAITDAVVEEKALNEIKKADSSRLVEWALALHRRLDYHGALVLAQAAFEKNPQSVNAASSLWVAGRSAHFLGKYDEALNFYNKLIATSNGSDEAAEALFRSSLIYLRRKDYTSASALLERLLSQGRDRYDLNAQYWLVRSLQPISADRAMKATQSLLEKYPFSYYGLRLKAEANKGLLSWSDSSADGITLNSEIFLVGSQKAAWTRFNILSQAGWVSEAHQEIQEGPVIKDPTLKVCFAQKLSERQQYFTAIRLLNEALEADPHLRRAEFLKIGYPEVFDPLYQKESARYGIDAILLRSLTRQESGFNMRAVSTSNALGLMQMIPPTAQEVSKSLGLQVSLPEDMFRPEVNIPMGSFYLSQMLDQFQGNVPFSLAAYNAGPHRLKAWMDGREEVKTIMSKGSSEPLDELWFDELPWNETSLYVKAILRNALIYKMINKESYTLSPVLWQDLVTKKTK